MSGPFVGVDVVDRTRARAVGRVDDDRFVRRVFSAGERDRIRQAVDPDAELWRLWAAKEAAYKVISKLQSAPPVFRHAEFRVVDPPGSPVRELAWTDLRVSLGVSTSQHQVLAWAWIGEVSPLLVGHESVVSARARLAAQGEPHAWIPERFSREEVEAIHGLESALVRLAARADAARMLGVSEERLAIVCRPGHTGLRPPYLQEDGSLRRDADISLSHDGAFLAWAIRLAS